MTCPTCGTVTFLEELSRDADAFCRVCDFPLFWSRTARVTVGGEGGDIGLRRLPGTAGRVAVATISCPVCTEPNPVTRTICIRCGSELRPVPPPPAPPPPPPPPEPVVVPVVEPEVHQRWWPWVLVAFAALIAVVLLVVLLVV